MQRLLVLGVVVVAVGFALVVAGAVSQGGSSAGGVVFIGPFPIVFGSGPGSGTLAALSLLIGAVMVALMLLWGWRLFADREE